MRTRTTERILCGLALLLVLAGTARASLPQEDGIVVVGRVTNGTAGARVPGDLPVALHVFSGTEELAAYETALNDEEGAFRFDGPFPDRAETFVVRVVYRDVTYLSNFGSLHAGQEGLSLPVVIYETTEDAAALRIAQLHVFLGREEDRLRVAEHYLVDNEGDRTYAGTLDGAGQRITLPFALPANADGLRFEEGALGERFVAAREGGFADTRPIPPGPATVEVAFTYELPYRRRMPIERTFDLPVASVAIVPMAGVEALAGEGLTPVDRRGTSAEVPGLYYAAGPLAAGEPLVFALGRPSRSMAQEIGVGLMALAAAAVAIYLLWRPTGPGPLPARARPPVEAIAALDAAFEAGRIPEGSYRSRREALVRKVRGLLIVDRDDEVD